MKEKVFYKHPIDCILKTLSLSYFILSIDHINFLIDFCTHDSFVVGILCVLIFAPKHYFYDEFISYCII